MTLRVGQNSEGVRCGAVMPACVQRAYCMCVRKWLRQRQTAHAEACVCPSTNEVQGVQGVHEERVPGNPRLAS